LNAEGVKVSRIFPKGTILVTIAANIGESAIADFPVACPDSLVGVIPNEEINGVWLNYAIQLAKSELERRATQGAQKNINLETLRPLLIPTPPRRQQDRIADILSAWEHAVELTEKQYALLGEYLKGLVQTLYSQSCDSKRQLKDLCEIIYGKSPIGILSNEGKVPVIGTGGVTGYTDQIMFDKPIVVLGRKGTIDRPALTNGSSWVIDTAYGVVPKQGVDLNWLYFLFRSMNLAALSESSGLPSLGRERVYKLTVDTPTLERQEKIGLALATLTHEMQLLKNQTSAYKRQREGILSSLCSPQGAVT
jgi:type I restriction enzyme S subunit